MEPWGASADPGQVCNTIVILIQSIMGYKVSCKWTHTWPRTHITRDNKTYWYNPKNTALLDMQATAGGGTHNTQPTRTYVTTKKPRHEASPLKQRRGQSDPNDVSHPLPRKTHHGRDHDTTTEMIGFTSPWSLLHLLLRWHFGTSSEGTLAEQLCL